MWRSVLDALAALIIETNRDLLSALFRKGVSMEGQRSLALNYG